MKNLFDPPKFVKMTLVGVDSNAFSVIAAFKKEARRQGWASKEIDTVMNKAMSGDYNHLLAVYIAHCDMGEMDEVSDDEYNEFLEEWEAELLERERDNEEVKNFNTNFSPWEEEERNENEDEEQDGLRGEYPGQSKDDLPW